MFCCPALVNNAYTHEKAPDQLRPGAFLFLLAGPVLLPSLFIVGFGEIVSELALAALVVVRVNEFVVGVGDLVVGGSFVVGQASGFIEGWGVGGGADGFHRAVTGLCFC